MSVAVSRSDLGRDVYYTPMRHPADDQRHYCYDQDDNLDCGARVTKFHACELLNAAQ